MISSGYPTTTVVVSIQILLYVIIQLYVPGFNPEAVAVVAPLLQRKVIGGVPPLIIFTVADPSLPPKHVTESDSVVNISSSGS